VYFILGIKGGCLYSSRNNVLLGVCRQQQHHMIRVTGTPISQTGLVIVSIRNNSTQLQLQQQQHVANVNRTHREATITAMLSWNQRALQSHGESVAKWVMFTNGLISMSQVELACISVCEYRMTALIVCSREWALCIC